MAVMLATLARDSYFFTSWALWAHCLYFTSYRWVDLLLGILWPYLPPMYLLLPLWARQLIFLLHQPMAFTFLFLGFLDPFAYSLLLTMSRAYHFSILGILDPITIYLPPSTNGWAL